MGRLPVRLLLNRHHKHAGVVRPPQHVLLEGQLADGLDRAYLESAMRDGAIYVTSEDGDHTADASEEAPVTEDSAPAATSTDEDEHGRPGTGAPESDDDE